MPEEGGRPRPYASEVYHEFIMGKCHGSTIRTCALYLSAPEVRTRAPAMSSFKARRASMILSNSRTWSRGKGFVAAAPDLYHRDPADCKDDAPTRRMRLRDSTVIADVNATVRFSEVAQVCRSGENRHRRFLHGRARGLSHVGGESGYQSRRDVLRQRSISRPGATAHRRSSGPRIFTARSWVTSAKTIKIHRRRT